MYKSMKRVVLLQLEGYNLDKAKRAVAEKFVADNPTATITKAAKALGISYYGARSLFNKFGVSLERPLTKKEAAAIALLEKRGHRVQLNRKVEPTNRGRKRLIIDFSALDYVGGRVVLVGKKEPSAKRYVNMWAKDQPEKMTFTFLEDAYGTTVIRKT